MWKKSSGLAETQEKVERAAWCVFQTKGYSKHVDHFSTITHPCTWSLLSCIHDWRQCWTSVFAFHCSVDSDSWAQHVRKTRMFDLDACICGIGMSEVEIQAGDSVMRCKVHRCETVWVSHVIKLYSSHCSFAHLVSLHMHELWFCTEILDMRKL